MGRRAVWTGGKSRPHRDSISDCPARSQSLHRMSYPAHIYIYIYIYTHTVIKESCAPDDHITNNPHTTDDLKMAITEYIRNMDRAVLNTVFENTVRRISKCLETGGRHFEHYL